MLKKMFKSKIEIIGIICAGVLGVAGYGIGPLINIGWSQDVWNNIWSVVGGTLGAGIGGYIAYKIAKYQSKSDERTSMKAFFLQHDYNNVIEIGTLIQKLGSCYYSEKMYLDQFQGMSFQNRISNWEIIHERLRECSRESSQIINEASELLKYANLPQIDKEIHNQLNMDVSYIDGFMNEFLKDPELYTDANKFGMMGRVNSAISKLEDGMAQTDCLKRKCYEREQELKSSY